jgi:FMN phosphatase YigB (HAD superfamily)
MTLTILLDLDDTLLENSAAGFIPAYLNALCTHLSKNTPSAEEILSTLMAATETMRQNTDPGKFLKTVFDPEFYAPLGWEYDIVHPQIEEFYRTTYPDLKQTTTPNPANRTVIEGFLDRGDRVIIATNPIFPLVAIDQRIDWSELSDLKDRFAFISSYENSHFTKPNPAYLAEVLAAIGWPDGPMVMVGDDFTADIEPALTLGIPVYWVNGDDGYTHDNNVPIGRGELEQLPAWLDAQTEEALTPEFNGPAVSLAIHQAIPAALHTLVGEIPEEIWHLAPETTTWNLTEIFCHLRDVDKEIYIPRLEHVIQAEKPFFEAINADPWAEEREYRSQNGPKAFEDFVLNRKRLLELIDQIPTDAWRKELRHTIFGPVTYPELLRISARHDILHLQQIFQNLEFSQNQKN